MATETAAQSSCIARILTVSCTARTQIFSTERTQPPRSGERRQPAAQAVGSNNTKQEAPEERKKRTRTRQPAGGINRPGETYNFALAYELISQFKQTSSKAGVVHSIISPSGPTWTLKCSPRISDSPA